MREGKRDSTIGGGCDVMFETRGEALTRWELYDSESTCIDSLYSMFEERERIESVEYS